MWLMYNYREKNNLQEDDVNNGKFKGYLKNNIFNVVVYSYFPIYGVV